MKLRYRYTFRTIFPSPDPEICELEAGPFIPGEASAFGQRELMSRVMITGKFWTCNYSEIADSVPDSFPLRSALSALRVPLALGAFVFVASIVVAEIAQYRADAICRSRANDPHNVTLCHGTVYATRVFGSVECGCIGETR